MNFSFQIIPFYKGKRATFYTILIEGEELSEGDKFLDNERVKQNRHFADLRQVFFNLKDKYSARLQFFKDEGLPGDMVNALYVRRGNLRWYCLRWSNQMVIFGNGGEKNVRATQDDPFLKDAEYALRWVNQCFEKAVEREETWVTEDGEIQGNLVFDKEDYIERR